MNVRVDLDVAASTERDEHQSALFRSYLVSNLMCVTMLLSATAIFNYMVDPYSLFDSPRVEGFNALKPAAIKQVRMTKTYGVCRGEFKTILLGNSRVDVGLNPDSAEFPRQWCPVYNLGQPGTGSEAALLYLKHVLAHYRPANVIVAVDFLSFLEEPGQPLSTDAPSNESPERARLAVPGAADFNLAQTQQRIRDALTADLSLSALTDSVRTLAAQTNPYTATITESGFNTAQAFRALIRAEGQAALFQQKNHEYQEKLLRQRAPAFGSSREMQAILALLDLCRQQNIEVKLFIHPYHANVLDAIHRTGHWQEMQAWKQYLADACTNRHAELWDFSDYSAVTAEVVPPPGDHNTIMNGYWESGHYRDTTGDLVLGRMFGKSLEREFGVQLAPK